MEMLSAYNFAITFLVVNSRDLNKIKFVIETIWYIQLQLVSGFSLYLYHKDINILLISS